MISQANLVWLLDPVLARQLCPGIPPLLTYVRGCLTQWLAAVAVAFCFNSLSESDRRCGTEWGWLARLPFAPLH